MKNKKKIAIIGAGWFGCHIANDLLDSGFQVDIYEKEKDIFMGASGNNQNRLHLGFHYPRSYKTRIQSIKGFNEFVKKYPKFSNKIEKNLYFIANHNKNITDFDTYKSIMKSSRLNFKEIIPSKFGINNCEGGILCNERLIDFKKAKIFFKKKLNNKITFNFEIKKIKINNKEIFINQKKYKNIINCTWQQFAPLKSWQTKYEGCINFLYKKKIQSNLIAMTIMDGPFYSIYPWDKNHSTLYSVKYSRIINTKNKNKALKSIKEITLKELKNIKNKVEKEILYFYPRFLEDYKFEKYLKSLRTIRNFNTHCRESLIAKDNGVIHILSGKIDHIISSGNQIKKCLKEF